MVDLSSLSSVYTLPVLPLKDSVIFPMVRLPLLVGRKSSVEAVNEALLTEDQCIAIVAQKSPRTDEPLPEDLFSVGVVKLNAVLPAVGSCGSNRST